MIRKLLIRKINFVNFFFHIKSDAGRSNENIQRRWVADLARRGEGGS
jgi:hypothetical protein